MVLDEAQTSMDSLVRVIKDAPQMARLMRARDEQGERALVTLLRKSILYIKKVRSSR